MQSDAQAKMDAYAAARKENKEVAKDESRQQITAEITDTENLQPLCDAINAVAEKTKITAELKDVIGSAGNLYLNSCNGGFD